MDEAYAATGALHFLLLMLVTCGRPSTQYLLQVRQRGRVGHSSMYRMLETWLATPFSLLPRSGGHSHLEGWGCYWRQNLCPINSKEMAFGGDKPCFASDGGAAPHRDKAPNKSCYLIGAVFSMSSPYFVLATISRCCRSGAIHSIPKQLKTTESTQTGR